VVKATRFWLLPLAASVALSGCFWLNHNDHPDGYSDEELPSFSPAELGRAETTEVLDLNNGQVIGTLTSTVVSMTPARGWIPAIRQNKTTWHRGNLDKQLGTAREELWPDRIERYEDDDAVTPEVVLRTPLRVDATWHFTQSNGEQTTSTITAIHDVCTSHGFYPRAIQVTSTRLVAWDANQPLTPVLQTSWFAQGYGLVETTVANPAEPHAGFRHTLQDIFSPTSHRAFAPPPCGGFGYD
jgi:hypothetical protein